MGKVEMKSKASDQRSEVGSQRSAVCGLPSAVCHRRSSHGFTLLELLIVIALMVVLAGLLIPAFFKVQNEAKRKRASTEAAIIGTAIQAYKMRERKFPAPSNDLRGNRDVTYNGQGSNPNNSLVMGELIRVEPPVIDASKLRMDSNGNAMNPWGAQYKIRLDLNYDGKIDLNNNGQFDRDEYVEYAVE